MLGFSHHQSFKESGAYCYITKMSKKVLLSGFVFVVLLLFLSVNAEMVPNVDDQV